MIEIKELWKEKERECMLANFDNSDMKKDSKDISDFWRRKSYVKPEEMMLEIHERDFQDPYMIAQYQVGGIWNDYIDPFIIQIAYCNLDCHFCFVPKELRSSRIDKGKYFTSDEIVSIFIDECKKKEQKKAIFRISGGEPFLAPDFIVDIAKSLRKYENIVNTFLWIDTNLLGMKYRETVEHLFNTNLHFGIVGCLKGFNLDDLYYNINRIGITLDDQFKNAKIILEEFQDQEYTNNLFFYIPEITNPQSDPFKDIPFFINKMRTKIHPFAPLKTTVLRIKEYESNKLTMKPNRLDSGYTKKIWQNELKKIYPLNLLWLPQYQITMNKEDIIK